MLGNCLLLDVDSRMNHRCFNINALFLAIYNMFISVYFAKPTSVLRSLLIDLLHVNVCALASNTFEDIYSALLLRINIVFCQVSL